MSSSKIVLYIFITLGGAIGGYLPLWIWGADATVWSILTGGIGSIIGVWAWYKVGRLL